MTSNIVAEYGLFILELLTIVLLLAAIVVGTLAIKGNKKHKGQLKLEDLSESYTDRAEELENFSLSDQAYKAKLKAQKKADKEKAKAEKKKLKAGKHGEKHEAEDGKGHLYVLDFTGDVAASQTDSLRKEISAIIQVANPKTDGVLLRLESPGGYVHSYGLAASQLQRLRDKEIPLTIAVDEVAASGGYMMACVADTLVAAPFAVIGSIGVVAEVPNIHRLLKKYDVDVDVMTAGQYKRTVTFMGENTEEGKEKFRQELNETHKLFKDFVESHRPQLDLDQVATGEAWYGKQALDLHLVDAIATSDDLILDAITKEDKEVIKVSYEVKVPVMERLVKGFESSLAKVVSAWAIKVR